MVQILESDHWLCSLPNEWRAEQEDESIVIFDEDEVSTIEISTMKKTNGLIDSVTLNDFSAELVTRGLVAETVGLGDFKGVMFCFDEDKIAWREWYLAKNDVFLLVSHGCEQIHRGMDDTAVNEILSTLIYKDCAES